MTSVYPLAVVVCAVSSTFASRDPHADCDVATLSDVSSAPDAAVYTTLVYATRDGIPAGASHQSPFVALARRADTWLARAGLTAASSSSPPPPELRSRLPTSEHSTIRS